LAARRGDATFVDLFHERDNDPFLKDPDRFFAPDYLHPSNDGYGLWYDALKSQGHLAKALAAGGAEPAR
jgi:lysophospholipase L1-like esterase